jgi:GH24 family phage-related lysozyme (muramidase)
MKLQSLLVDAQKNERFVTKKGNDCLQMAIISLQYQIGIGAFKQ